MNILSGLDTLSTQGKHWLFVGLLAMTTMSVWLLGNPDFRFRALPDTFHLSQLKSDAGQGKWITTGRPDDVQVSADGITLKLNEPYKLQVHTKRFFNWDADVQAGATHFLISGQLERLSQKSSTPEPKKRPAFSVHLRDDGKRNGKGIMVRAKGAKQVENFNELLVPHPGSDQLDIYWKLFLPGEWRLNELAIRSVHQSTQYYLAMAATLMPLAMGILLMSRTFFRQLNPLQVIMLSSLLTVAIASIAIAESTMKQLRNTVLEQLPFDQLVGWWQLHLQEVQKSGHVVVFMLLTMVVFWVRKRIGATHGQLIAVLTMLALLTEALQRHSIGRTPRLEDVLLDLIGICIGYTIIRVSLLAQDSAR